VAPKLILTGFMATGKSVVGRIVAARLTWPFLDTDAELVKREGKPIAAIFSDNGEEYFRKLESELIAGFASDASRCPQCGCPRPAVIATGGGTLVDDRNYAAVRSIGVIVCLSARPEVVADRVRRSGEARPKLLEGDQPLEARIAVLMEQRRRTYERADFTVDTSDRTATDAAEAVLDFFACHGKARRCARSA
jgi:shikimate kinase